MSGNENAAVSTGPTGGKTRWSAEEELVLLLQIVKQVLDKDGTFAINFPQIIIDGRTSRGVKERWADLKKKANKYDTSDVAAVLLKQNTAAKKMSAAKVNDEDKPKKKAGAGAAGGRKIAKVKATKKEKEDADYNDTHPGKGPTLPPKKQVKAAKKHTVKKEKEPEKEADDKEAGSDSESAPPPKTQGKVAKKDAAKKNEKDADDDQNDTSSDAESFPTTKKQKPNSPNPRKRKAGEKASIFGPAKAGKGKELKKKDNDGSEDGNAEAAAAAKAVLDVEAEDEA